VKTVYQAINPRLHRQLKPRIKKIANAQFNAINILCKTRAGQKKYLWHKHNFFFYKMKLIGVIAPRGDRHT